jgi:hypothetical protein
MKLMVKDAPTPGLFELTRRAVKTAIQSTSRQGGTSQATLMVSPVLMPSFTGDIGCHRN